MINTKHNQNISNHTFSSTTPLSQTLDHRNISRPRNSRGHIISKSQLLTSNCFMESQFHSHKSPHIILAVFQPGFSRIMSNSTSPVQFYRAHSQFLHISTLSFCELVSSHRSSKEFIFPEF